MLRTTVFFAMALAATQPAPRMTALMEAVRPLLPYPASNAGGDLPADGGSDAKWFVIWPTSADDARIIVRANPLNTEVQEASAAAMDEINRAVASAEGRARASYDRALEELRRSGKAGTLETISLYDEGIAGERIDAELEVVIEFVDPTSFEMTSGEAPAVQRLADGAAWAISVAANTYRDATDAREHYRAAETRVYFGLTAGPEVRRAGDQPRYRITVPAPPKAARAVAIRGNSALVSAITTGVNWAPLAPR